MFNKIVKLPDNINHINIFLKLPLYIDHSKFVVILPPLQLLASDAWNTQDINWNDQDWLFNVE